MPFTVTATATDHNNNRVDATRVEYMGDAMGVLYATRDEAEAARDALRESVDECPNGGQGVEYEVVGDDLVWVVMDDVALGAWAEQVHAEKGNPSNYAFFCIRQEAEDFCRELEDALAS